MKLSRRNAKMKDKDTIVLWMIQQPRRLYMYTIIFPVLELVTSQKILVQQINLLKMKEWS
jgi:hypothetical protein